MSPSEHPTIVFFTNSVAMGGMEAHIAMLAAGLRRRGMEVAAIVPDYDTIAPFRTELEAAGVIVRVMGDASGRAGLPQRLVRMVRELRQHRPFIFHLHNTGSDGGSLPIVAARLAGARAILRTEHLPPLPPVSARQRAMVRLRDVITTRVICVSEEAREQHVAIYGRRPGKLVAVANGIRASDYQFTSEDRVSARALLGAVAGDVVVGAIGRMAEERKGFGTFIEAAEAIAAARTDARFVLVGDGPLRGSLEQLAERRDLKGRLKFTGAIDNRNVLPGIDVFVSPSLSDGGPITVLEAMAAGVPVVSTNIGIAREAIDDGMSGRLVAPRDARAMADATIALCANAQARATMGQRARAAVLAGFTIDHMIERVFNLYSSLSGGTPSVQAEPDLSGISG
jgi:glycosyltransferase involved in cell wall biosynthesis